MTTIRRDVISSFFLGAGALSLYAYVSQFPVRANQPAAVSAGFYPRILALILAVLASVQLITTLYRWQRSRNDGTTATHSSAVVRIWKDAASLRLFLLTITALVIYPFMMRLFGFSITGLAFIGTLIYALSPEQRKGRGLLMIAVITLAIGLITFIVFRYFLNIPFPQGILFDR